MTPVSHGSVHNDPCSADDEVPVSVTSGLDTSLAHLGQSGKSKTLSYCICLSFVQPKHSYDG
jgi:hypothetical protein